MSRIVRFVGAMVAAATVSVATSSVAAPISLACSASPGGQPTMFFTVDAATGVVQMNIGTFQAQVTDDAMIWRVPAADLGGGGFRPAGTYVLNRKTGELNISGDDFMSSAFCRQAGPAVIP